jgi:hypothetical protein
MNRITACFVHFGAHDVDIQIGSIWEAPVMKRILKFSASCFLLWNLAGCATYPPSTGFIPAQGEDFGYLITPLKNDMHVSVYKGNKYTRSDAALAYAMLAAYEYCQKKQMIGFVTTPENLSSKETRTNVGSYSIPQYNAYTKSTTYMTQVYSYPVTDVYPRFEVAFACSKNFKRLACSPTFEDLGRDLVHNVTKDFSGGILVKSVRPEELGKPFLENDVVTRVGKQRVEDQPAMLTAFDSAPENSVQLEIIRSQKLIKVTAQLIDISSIMKNAMNDTVDMLCEHVPYEENESQTGSMRAVPHPVICKPRQTARKRR